MASPGVRRSSTVKKPRSSRGDFGSTPQVLRLFLTINGTPYSVSPTPVDSWAAVKAYRLQKADGTAYDVARMAWGNDCDCPDFIFRREGIDPEGCKHIKAMVACGLLERREGGNL